MMLHSSPADRAVLLREVLFCVNFLGFAQASRNVSHVHMCTSMLTLT